ncbi:hypothetical protein ACCO45_003141 [Purpureocillium lilacinum]|uniref:Uncharacterized protein n=1 Tax=Purpureocillium lilacinum TaxID=33203 RepID=A0ACC4E003_PURLI
MTFSDRRSPGRQPRAGPRSSGRASTDAPRAAGNASSRITKPGAGGGAHEFRPDRAWAAGALGPCGPGGSCAWPPCPRWSGCVALPEPPAFHSTYPAMSGCSALSRAPWAFHLSSASRPTPTGRRDVTEARPSNPRTTLTPTQTQYPPIPFGFRQRNVKIQQRASRAAGEVFLVLCTMDPAKVRARFPSLINGARCETLRG